MKSKIAKYLFYIIIFVSPLIFFTDLTRNPYYFQIVFAQSGISLLWIIILIKDRGEIKHKIGPLDLPFIIFYSFAIITWLIAIILKSNNYHIPSLLRESYLTYGKNYLQMSIFNEGFKKFIFTIANVILVFLFAVNFIDKKNFKKIYYIFFLTALIASVYGILQYFGIEIIWPKVLNPFGGRCVSTFGNPNFLSSYLIMLIPVSFAFFLSDQNKIFMFIVMITSYCALLATLTRSSWFGLFVSLLSFIIILFFTQKDIYKKKIRSISFFLVIFTVIFLFWPSSPVSGYNPPALSRLFEVQQSAKTTYGPLHQRLLIWSCGFNIIKDNILIGNGWGLYELFYPFYQGKFLFIEKFRGLRTHANNAHNEIIEIWSQTGTIGLGLYILFFIIFFVYGIKIINSLENKNDKILITGIIVSIIGMLIDNLLNVTIHFCIPALLFYINIASLATFDETRKCKTIKLNTPMNILLIIFLSFIIFRLVFNFLGEINYFKGFKYSKRGELELAHKYLLRANKFQKYEVNCNYELANTLARLKKTKESIHFYYEALASNCGYDEIHFNLATVYSQNEKFDISKLHYSQALYINPLSQESYMALGGILISEKGSDSLAQSALLFERATLFYPNNKDFYNNLGYIYLKLGQKNKALENYYKALKIDPYYELAKTNYITLSNELGIKDNIYLRYQKLKDELERNIKNNRLEDGLQNVQAILEIFPNDDIAKFYMANILFSKGEVDKSIEIFNELITKNPENLNARYNLSIAYLRKNNISYAREQLEYIISKDPNNALVKKQLESLTLRKPALQ